MFARDSEKEEDSPRGCQKLKDSGRERGKGGKECANVYVNFSFCTRTLTRGVVAGLLEVRRSRKKILGSSV